MILKNRRQEIFAQSIAKGLSQTDAALSAGYSEARARSQGCHLAKNPKVGKRIQELAEKVTERVTAATGISKAWVLEKLRENVERAMQSRAVLDSKGKESGQYTWQPNAANKGLELIGKELGMFVDRARVSIEDLRALPTEKLLTMMEDIDARLEQASEPEKNAIH